MPNIKSTINAHNRTVISKIREGGSSKYGEGCNCREVKEACPLRGECLKTSLVYRAEVVSGGVSKFYIGLTSTTFKARWANHKTSFNLGTKEHENTLSTYIWTLKKQNMPYIIRWEILEPIIHPRGQEVPALCVRENPHRKGT